MKHSTFGVLIVTLALAACSSAPVADLRASGDNAALYQRDLTECRSLVREAYPWAIGTVQPALWRCLEGRGHSIIRID
jgi:hypothetical protein